MTTLANSNKPTLYIVAYQYVDYNTRIHKQALLLSDLGFDVHVICFGRIDNDGFEDREKYCIHRVVIKSLKDRVKSQWYRVVSFLRMFSPYKLTPRLHLKYRKGLLNKKNHYEANIKTQNNGVRVRNKKTEHILLQLFARTIFEIITLCSRALVLCEHFLGKPIGASFKASAQRFFKVLFITEFAFKCANVIERAESNVYFAHDLYALPVAYWLSRRHNCQFVYDSVELSLGRNRLAPPGLVSRFMISRTEALARKADAVFAAWPYLKKILEKKYGVKRVVLLLNCPQYRPYRRSSYLDDKIYRDHNTLIVLYIGVITEGRGIKELIESVKYLNNRFKVVLIGPVAQNYKEQLNRVLRKEANDSRLFILDPVPPNKVVEYASSADVGIIPIQDNCLTQIYCLPNKLFQNIMAGLPIVANNLKGIGTYVKENGLGSVFNDLLPQSIADAINRLVIDNNSFQAIRNRVLEKAKEMCWEKEKEKFVKAMEPIYLFSRERLMNM